MGGRSTFPARALGDHGCQISYPDTDQSIPDATPTVLVFADEVFDTDGYFTASEDPSTLTIPGGQAGKYLVSCNVFAATPAGAGVLGVRVLLNGGSPVSPIGNTAALTTSPDVFQGCSASGELLLEVGDEVTFEASQVTTGALDVGVTASLQRIA